MPIFTEPLPLSLYIHLPWCVRKCPYCDFNSHEAKEDLPEMLYVEALLQELQDHLPLIKDRPLISIFFGGGTPSLFSGPAISKILAGVKATLPLAPHLEITLEANPGTTDQDRFYDFRHAGINRLSLGIQSLQSDKLKTLGRIHDQEQALNAITHAKAAGFENINIDIMYGLPHQSIEDALSDINLALAFKPTHFSWYQLTIEPNTLFYHQTPPLPPEDLIWEMQLAGQKAIRTAGFKQYEISAYAQPHQTCIHNLNYWTFGDYLGLGAGAHSKITLPESGTILRFAQVKNPRDYLLTAKRKAPTPKIVTENECIFEFMLNALRLTQGVPLSLWQARTGLPLSRISPLIELAKNRDLLIRNENFLCPSTLGKQFLNDLVSIFLV